MQKPFGLIAAMIASAALACGGAYAQGTTPSTTGGTSGSTGATAPGTSPSTPSPPAAGSTGTDKGMGTGASAKAGAQSNRATTGTGTMSSPSAGKLASGDRKFVQEAAEGSKAEVTMGQLAQSKGGSDAVKQFGQKMVTDHQKAYDQVAQIGSGKGVNVPTEPSKTHQRDAAKLEKLSGNDFDREYARMMVSDHKKDVSDFKKQAKSAKDPDVRTFASSTLPTLEEHLKMAQDMEATVRKEHTAEATK